jgi:hypothetical protein
MDGGKRALLGGAKRDPLADERHFLRRRLRPSARRHVLLVLKRQVYPLVKKALFRSAGG